LSVSGTKGAYLLDSNGQWHVTGTVAEAREEDPPPLHVKSSSLSHATAYERWPELYLVGVPGFETVEAPILVMPSRGGTR